MPPIPEAAKQPYGMFYCSWVVLSLMGFLSSAVKKLKHCIPKELEFDRSMEQFPRKTVAYLWKSSQTLTFLFCLSLSVEVSILAFHMEPYLVINCWLFGQGRNHHWKLLLVLVFSTIHISIRILLSLSFFSAPHPGSILTVLWRWNITDCWSRDFKIFSGFGTVIFIDNSIPDALRQQSCLHHCEKENENSLCSKKKTAVKPSIIG